MDLNALWQRFLDNIEEQISSIVYETWFANTRLFELNDSTAKVEVPMPVTKKMLKESYIELIENTFTEVAESNFNFEFYTEEELKKNIKIDTDEIGIPFNSNFESNLKSHYQFENFIVGASNKFARTTAFAVAEQPGCMYNPLFIYGNSGLGKTHLMHSIGNYIIKNSKKRVLYVTSEQFVNDFIEISRFKTDGNNIEDVKLFKNKYRNVDVLMIDDIQYLQNANSTQQEFFNTFNELYNNNKQIIISSDRSPEDLNKLEQRLQTRFNWGITTDILPPDFQLRIDIINKKIEGNNMGDDFTDDVKEYIASNCTSDIRKLEGAITRVMAYAGIMNKSEITYDLALEALRDYFVKSVYSKNKIEQVQQIIASNYNITIDDLKSKRRISKIAVPRQIAMYICRIKLDETLPKIGMAFGGKDHTTVMHSVDKIKKEILKDQNLEIQIEKIMEQIK